MIEHDPAGNLIFDGPRYFTYDGKRNGTIPIIPGENIPGYRNAANRDCPLFGVPLFGVNEAIAEWVRAQGGNPDPEYVE